MEERKTHKIIASGLLALILGASFIASASIVSRTFLEIKKSEDLISVSGSAKQAVTADSARWTGNFSRSVFKDQLKDGYAGMKADEQIVRDFFVRQGFDKVEISPIFMNEMYKMDQNAPTQYNLVQNIEIKSDDVQKMKALAKNSEELASKGIIFSANPVEYYYSQLPDVRISLLPEALKDAKKRAEAIASSSGKSVDSIKSVSMGVVQVMPAGSTDISDYGLYDTGSIDKEIMITVKASFSLR
jgi:hypothetical protein